MPAAGVQRHSLDAGREALAPSEPECLFLCAFKRLVAWSVFGVSVCACMCAMAALLLVLMDSLRETLLATMTAGV